MIRATLIPAVAYYRMSTDRQDKSIPSQRREVEKYAAANGYKILRDYADEGISGDATEKRVQFKQMIADAAERGDFEAILCWDQDRFGRFNSLEAGYWIHPLMKTGIRLATVAQGAIDWNDFGGRLMYMIQQDGKHQYLVDLARNMTRGLRDRFLEGKWCGKAPYGYRVGPEGRLELGDPAEVAAVREIFRLRVEGSLGYGMIAHTMNQQGITAPRGDRWNVCAVRNILSRETYCGHIVYGLDRRSKHYTIVGGEVTRVVPGSDRKAGAPMRVPNTHPAIVDEQTFQAAGVPASVKIHARTKSEGAPLAGLLNCGRCGAPMYAVCYAGRGAAYLCSTAHTHKGCGHCKVPQKQAMDLVTKIVRERVLMGSVEALEAAIAKEVGRRAAPKVDTGADARQLERLERQIANATDRLVSVDKALVPAVEKKLLELQRERETLLRAKPKAPAKTLDPKQIAADVWRLDDLLRTASPAKVRLALANVVKQITLEFVPGKLTGRGQSYEFTGGTAELYTKACPTHRRPRW